LTKETSVSEPRFYRLEDADPHALDDHRVAVVGYGNLGASLAANLRDAGLDLTVGNVDDDYRRAAEGAGFLTTGIAEAVAGADLTLVLLPDEVIPEVFAAGVGPNLQPGSAVAFASGYCLAYGLVEVPAGVDVLLFAPRMLGEEVRRAAASGEGFFSYVSVECDATGKARHRLLALAAAAGSLQRGAMQLGARDEALLDLLVEQTVGPYLGTAIQLAFAAGTDAGLPPEAMVLELYQSGEMSRTFAAFAEHGFYRSVNAHGATATFGGFVRTLELDREAMARHFAAVVDDIAAGRFAERFQAEAAAGYPALSAVAAMTTGGDAMSQAETRVREALGLQR
jgi:ketol-acid reductoisomerase